MQFPKPLVALWIVSTIVPSVASAAASFEGQFFRGTGDNRHAAAVHLRS